MQENKRLLLWLIVIVVIVGIFVWLFVGITDSSNSVIKLGAILPLSVGPNAYLGENIQKGLNLAVEQINKDGGVAGKNLEIIYEDNGSETSKALLAYQKLTTLDSVKIIFPSASDPVLAMAPLANKDKILLFAIGTASPKVSDAGDFVFRHAVLPQTESKILAKAIIDLGYTELGVIRINTVSTTTYIDEFKKQYENLGGKIIVEESFEKSATDFKNGILKIKEKGIPATFVLTYAQENGTILKEAKELGYNGQFFAGYTAEDQKMLDASDGTAEGMIYTHFFNPKSVTTQNAKLYYPNFKQKYSYESDPVAALAYDGLLVVAKAMKICGSDDPICVKDELYKIKDFPGATGKITIDKNGDTEKDIFLKTVKNNEFVKYDTNS